MATPFTDVEKANIRLYMGWSARFHQGDSRLEQAMSAIAGESSDATHDLVTGLLTTIEDIDTRITSSYNRMKANKVGSIDLPGAQELGLLRSEGRRFVGRLASILGIETRHDVFSGSTPRGGHDVGGGLSGGGNEMKHG